MKGMTRKQYGQIVRSWIDANQGKHKCGCGCGEFIEIKLHHHARGIPKFVNGHASRVANCMVGRTGHLNPNFKGGRYINADGYVLIRDDNRPGRFKYVLEHRRVMELHLGRTLRDDEVVHHLNREKTDNRIENLELMTNSDHTSHHAVRGEVGFGYHGYVRSHEARQAASCAS